MKKIIFILIMALMINIVAAEEGLANYPVDRPLTFDIPLYDQSNNHLNSATVTKLTLYYPNGTILISNKSMTWNENYFSYNLSGSQMSTIGIHWGELWYANGNMSGSVIIEYEITPTGSTYTIAQSITYALLMLFSLFIFIFCTYYAFMVQGENARNMENKVIRVNYKKYLKMFLMAMSWGSLLLLVYSAWHISWSFLYATPLSNFFKMLFRIIMVLSYPIFFVGLILFIMNWVKDKKIQDMLQRGLTVR